MCFEIQVFGKCHRAHIFGFRQSAIKQAEKIRGIIRIMLPRIFSVQDHGYYIVSSIIRQALMDSAQTPEKVGYRICGIPLIVGKSKKVRQRVVAEEKAGPVLPPPVCAIFLFRRQSRGCTPSFLE
ncbi:MAG: hypothetical protein RBG13Loki_1865 [Promethearchaeota archaeon CR_4]|nr:MAG: hypothetical protein RBG13Loki_1865 [Candidatus Lokiarchaeota archaeon CR_4]